MTVDCLRRDRLSAYGYERNTTPFLDGLLDRALHATSAHSVSSWTCPAVISLMTGLYPHHHGGGLVPGHPKNLSKANLPTALPAEVPMLSELLARRGYASAAIGGVWNAHLAIRGRFPLMEMVQRPAGTLIRRALRWIRRQRDPFFLWLHLGDTHEPLRVPLRTRSVFGRVPRIARVRRWDYTKADDAVGTEDFHRYREARIRLYDAAVRSVDARLERLWKALGHMGVRERTLFVVTSDHGEEFWEHRAEEMEGFSDPRNVYGTGHGHNLFQVHLLVPLVVLGPGITPEAVHGNVSLVDVLPTLFDAAAIEAPIADGRSLLSPLDPDRPILAEGIAYGHEKASVVWRDMKLLRSSGDGYEEVFRLGSDRREAEVVPEPGVADRLRGYLPEGPTAMGEQVAATEEIERHLRNLGYIE